ncbi:MAG TPA: DUF2235 domain-containing protein [Gemmataceae bacterium]|jgi:uncharacterized protein (DUF2235 family)
MKRIVLCFDGTWNKPGDEAMPPEERVESNVSRFYRSVAGVGADGVEQVKWYNQGVGTQWYDRIAGGAFGAGLDFHIIAGYQHLAETYADGDEVYIVGFSRGAYTARSLVGMVRNCGLVSAQAASWLAPVAYGIYRTRDDGPDSRVAVAFRSHFAREISIRFVGVWDTVGALGIPLRVFDRLNREFHAFHDLRLSKIVGNAYHAVALDEHREDYDVCLWEPSERPEQTLEQRWFVGAHADVGGGYADDQGYAERRLSDIALRWLQEKAAALGLGLDPVTVADTNYRGPIHDSYAEFLDGLYAREHQPHYRGVLATSFGNEMLDKSIDLRRGADAGYRPPNEGLPALGG